MHSIWYQMTKRPWVPQAKLPKHTEIAIIGGGLSGVLLAYRLTLLGIDCTLLEAEEIGAGQSGRTTGKVTLQRGLMYERLIKTAPREDALAWARGAEGALRDYATLIDTLSISCEMERCSAILYTRASGGRLEGEAQAARMLGIKAELTRRCELPFPFELALAFPNQMKLNPLALLWRLKEEIQAVEHCRVNGVHSHEIETTQGVISAEKIVFAAHYPLMNLPALHFLTLTQSRSYSIALAGVEKLPHGIYYGIDRDGVSLAAVGGHLILCGGSHRTGETAGNPFYRLRTIGKSYYPKGQVVAKWSAQDCMSPDGLPLIGPYSRLTPDWYLITGHSKWGMLGAMLGANMLTKQLLGESTPLDRLLSPSRVHAPEMRASGKGLKEALRGYANRFFREAREAAEELPLEYGAIVIRHGVKMGIYRDKDGVEWAVKPVCSHLGCEVSWNGVTRTWDCPCHGSRFDYKGMPLDDPAMRPLTRLNPKNGKLLKGEYL